MAEAASEHHSSLFEGVPIGGVRYRRYGYELSAVKSDESGIDESGIDEIVDFHAACHLFDYAGLRISASSRDDIAGQYPERSDGKAS
ncbi:hypothetical protein HJB86_32475 [Rhizobium sp. NZLR3b]|uniref:hypothetical protein n=1 Tax=Rhizobium sp. NZLR3b TaxID=2731101 RepID=UPI001C82A33E|nr:hypothetical protein [Rhizobium sp. NZLR3b]MBX5193549.1 hypothetical protein [Rhizobium sp. NZLR3b]